MMGMVLVVLGAIRVGVLDNVKPTVKPVKV
jgi:hypothetical protein